MVIDLLWKLLFSLLLQLLQKRLRLCCSHPAIRNISSNRHSNSPDNNSHSNSDSNLSFKTSKNFVRMVELAARVNRRNTRQCKIAILKPYLLWFGLLFELMLNLLFKLLFKRLFKLLWKSDRTFIALTLQFTTCATTDATAYTATNRTTSVAQKP